MAHNGLSEMWSEETPMYLRAAPAARLLALLCVSLTRAATMRRLLAPVLVALPIAQAAFAQSPRQLPVTRESLGKRWT